MSEVRGLSGAAFSPGLFRFGFPVRAFYLTSTALKLFHSLQAGHTPRPHPLLRHPPPTGKGPP